MLGSELATFLAGYTPSFGAVNTTLFYNDVPGDPDALISILEYSGEADEPDLGIDGTKTRYETKRFQLYVRGIRGDSNGPELICTKAKAALVTILNTTISGVRYVGVDCLTPPSKLMADDNLRAIWICNMRAIKAPSTS